MPEPRRGASLSPARTVDTATACVRYPFLGTLQRNAARGTALLRTTGVREHDRRLVHHLPRQRTPGAGHRTRCARHSARDVAYLKGDWTEQDPEITSTSRATEAGAYRCTCSTRRIRPPRRGDCPRCSRPRSWWRRWKPLSPHRSPTDPEPTEEEPEHEPRKNRTAGCHAALLRQPDGPTRSGFARARISVRWTRPATPTPSPTSPAKRWCWNGPTTTARS
jgi:hypothetical protein